MLITSTDFFGILPEIILLVSALAVLLLGAFCKNSDKPAFYLTQLSLLVVTVVSIYMYHLAPSSVFQDAFILDPLAYILKISIYIDSFIVFLYS